MSSLPKQRRANNSTKRHLHETRLQILLPAGLGVALIIMLAGITMLFPPSNRAGISLIADWMLLVFVLCPAAICLFAAAVMMMALAFSLSKVHTVAARPLRRVEALSEKLYDRTVQVTDKVNAATVNTSARFAMFDKVLGVFDRPDTDEGQKDNHDRNNPA